MIFAKVGKKISAMSSGPRKSSLFSLVAHALEKHVYPAVLDAFLSIVLVFNFNTP